MFGCTKKIKKSIRVREHTKHGVCVYFLHIFQSVTFVVFLLFLFKKMDLYISLKILKNIQWTIILAFHIIYHSILTTYKGLVILILILLSFFFFTFSLVITMIIIQKIIKIMLSQFVDFFVVQGSIVFLSFAQILLVHIPYNHNNDNDDSLFQKKGRYFLLLVADFITKTKGEWQCCIHFFYLFFWLLCFLRYLLVVVAFVDVVEFSFHFFSAIII